MKIIGLYFSQKRSQLQDKSKYSFVQDKFKKEFFEIISEGFSDFYSIRQENFSSQSCAHYSLNISPRLEDQPKKVQDLSKKVPGKVLDFVILDGTYILQDFKA